MHLTSSHSNQGFRKVTVMTMGKYKVREGKVWRIMHMPKHEIKSTQLKELVVEMNRKEINFRSISKEESDMATDWMWKDSVSEGQQ